MNRSLITMMVAASAVLWIPSISGQSAPTVVTPLSSTSTTVADQQWESLKNLGRPVTLALSNGAIGKNPSPAELAGALVAQANQLKGFYSQYPTHAAAKEAKRLEGLALSRAAINGDASQDARRRVLLEEIRKDASVPEVKRYEAVAWDRQVTVSRQAPATHAAKMTAQEDISRALVAEFPGVALGYESLLAVAHDSDPARARAVLADLRGMQMQLPPRVASESLILAERLTLIGRPLAAILGPAGAPALATAIKHRPVVLYAWEPGNKYSISTARRMAKMAPSALLIGVCLSTDPIAARTAAQREKIPGEQYLDPRGAASALAITLQFNRAPLVYLVDRAGQIADVNGLVDTGEKLARIIR